MKKCRINIECELNRNHNDYVIADAKCLLGYILELGRTLGYRMWLSGNVLNSSNIGISLKSSYTQMYRITLKFSVFYQQ